MKASTASLKPAHIDARNLAECFDIRAAFKQPIGHYTNNRAIFEIKNSIRTDDEGAR